jgi:hypothetical protein
LDCLSDQGANAAIAFVIDVRDDSESRSMPKRQLRQVVGADREAVEVLGKLG